MTALDTAGAATTLIKEQLPYVDPVNPRRTGLSCWPSWPSG